MSEEDRGRFDLESYAQLRAQLAGDGVDRDALLATHGLDEDSWDAIDADWQAMLSRDLEQEGDDVPASMLRYAAAFMAAQSQASTKQLDFELFAACARAIRSSRDPKLALEKLGVTLTDFLQANQHWTPRLAKDVELAARFERALRGSRS